MPTAQYAPVAPGGQPPSTKGKGKGLIVGLGIAQGLAAGIEALVPDPGAQRLVGVAEQLVQIARGDAAGAGDRGMVHRLEVADVGEVAEQAQLRVLLVAEDLVVQDDDDDRQPHAPRRLQLRPDVAEATVAEAGGMMYMDAGIQMETIFGDGSQTRSFTYITDLVDGIIKLAVSGLLLYFALDLVHISTVRARLGQVDAGWIARELAVLVLQVGRWEPAPSFRRTFWDVVRVVTAFTVAHSVTLGLAATGLWMPSPRVIEPLIVRQRGGRYQIIAGERRWRAAQRAQIHEVPVLVIDLTDAETLEVALIENLQRQDLSPVEEALGYRRLQDEFGHTQEQLASSVGKSRAHVANTMRLLALPQSVLDLIEQGKLSAGQARPLIGRADAVFRLEGAAVESVHRHSAAATVRRDVEYRHPGGRQHLLDQ